MKDLSMLEYQQTVETFAKTGTNFLFHNQGNEHALIVFKSIFQNARRLICIAADSLANLEVANSDEYITSLKEYLNQENSRLQILLANPKPDMKKIPLFEMLKLHPAYQQGRIEIKDGQGKNFRRNGNVFHFCVADNRMYRIESDIDQRSAECNFGDMTKSALVLNLYSNAFNKISECCTL